MIEVANLTKTYGGTTVLDDVTFTVRPGMVTGFLGPNGAGKSTTMRLIMGLEQADAGSATILGRPLAEHPAPLRSVGALLDARSLNPARKARQSLLALADTHSIPASRVDEVLALTGLTQVADRRSGGFSLGMGQRLGIAAALLGDPEVLVLDEPVNGLDPEGVTWVRQLCRSLAAEGRTVLISSHLMSEVAQTADRVVVIGQGKILADAGVDEFVGALGDAHVKATSADAAKLGMQLTSAGAEVQRVDETTLQVKKVDAEGVGRAALDVGAVLSELVEVRPSLEQAYLALTSGAVEYRSGGVLTDPTGRRPVDPGAVLTPGSRQVGGPDPGHPITESVPVAHAAPTVPPVLGEDRPTWGGLPPSAASGMAPPQTTAGEAGPTPQPKDHS